MPSAAPPPPPERKQPKHNERVPAPERSIVRVAVDVPLPHLDRSFDYRVPVQLDEATVVGARVRVRFAGRMVDGFVLDRSDHTDHDGRLGWLDKVVSPEPVLSPELAALCRTVADRYAGTLADVLRLAVPPRHARVEAEPHGPPDTALPPLPDDGSGWAAYPRGPAFLEALAAHRPAHGVWQALPGEDWATRLAEAAHTTLGAGRSAVVVVPDRRDLDRLHAACLAVLGEEHVAALAADLGPAERYRRWLAVARGEKRLAIGTRAAAFAPVQDPGLLVVWDDGDDSHADPRAPYPHTRDVLIARAHGSGAALLVGGATRTAEAEVLVRSGWAHPVVADRTTVRERAPRVTAIGEDERQLLRDPTARAARIPAVAFEATRGALAAGRPVLVQVPRRGYLPAVACAQCREPARCRRCHGPLGIPASAGDAPAPPTCRWCGRPATNHRCPACASPRLRATVVGSGRTAEELGRAFPQTVVRSSGGGTAILDTVDAAPAIVVATPGAEPVAEDGYGAALLLDGAALLARPELRAAEDTVRRWFAAASLVRPSPQGGRVVVVAESNLPAVQALVRWDPAGHAGTELDGRTELGLPPAVRMAALDGEPAALRDLLDTARLPKDADVLGPVELPPGTRLPGGEERTERAERTLVRVPRAEGRQLARALQEARAVRAARKDGEAVRILLDPHDPL
ncbi:primosomal protein N' [Actinomycetospora termitidis]|uniref:Probable replication restart protein PriA n=1 Tax=Actinomycetospora termitidis TaxID=3053470 RepID=A0ABT7MBF7_9PSEU|nr:primosomal protein N' [Actinomycetospora sp. Odt1-22]MDL5157995.1 primosomal protein N' [Actinomycetospora sp. Odt1-22]